MKNIFQIRLMKLSLLLLSVILNISLFAGCGETNADSNNLINEVEVTGMGETSDGFSYQILDDNKVVLLGYKGLQTVVTVPAKVEGKPVSVLESTFSNNENITEVFLPGSITTIGFETFKDATLLSSVIIPNSVKEICTSAFENCINLSSITLPEGINKIEDLAFSNCTALKNIIIPENITIINHGVFENCSALTHISLPSGITEIRGSAFENCTALTNIAIPYGVTAIGDYAFTGCTNLGTVTLANNYIDIGYNVFENTMWLQNQTADFVIAGDGLLIDINLSADVKDVVIPENVKTIAANMPQNGIMESVIFPAGLKDYNDFFDSEFNLKTITVSENNSEFLSEDGILFNKEQTLLLHYPANKAGETYTIPDGIKYAGTSFDSCVNLKTLVLPESMVPDTFSFLQDINKIAIDYNLQGIKDTFDITTLLALTFANYGNIETLCFKSPMPENAETITDWLTSR